ncbi:hypothetical protein BDV96DRAFT_352059 [Lophiotrema nucula]|uniref:F-box domain-containing protein n=1 Tax=Lophiotrema nucula TaxID=690887 RepID=A0A6A5ZKD5_9PLEO|nr:hypothetical protein BDV96DRAFT_352059 [Lophiotrema nucula]
MRHEVVEASRSLRLAAAGHMLQILRMFPDNALNTFRFISSHAIDVRTFVVLVSNHRSSLHHLHATFNSEDLLPEMSKQQLLHLNTLDIWIPLEEPLQNLIPLLKSQHRCLRRLCLVTCPKDRKAQSQGEPSWDYRSMDWTKLQEMVPAASGQEILRHVTLSGFNLRGVYKPISTIFDLRSLTHLSLLNSWQPQEFLEGLGIAAKAHDLELRHLAVDFGYEKEQMEDEARILDQFLSLCKTLRSLHIEWARSFPIKRILPRFQSLGNRLHSLGLHQGDRDPIEEQMLTGEQLLNLCSELPNLEQFAYEVLERQIYYPASFIGEVPITDLQNLRILYLRQGFGDPIEFAEDHISEIERNYVCQRFANELFEYLHSKGWCKKLQAIVIGRAMQVPYAHSQEDWDYTPRKCFVKGVQTDIFGRTSAVGVPAPTYLLRELTGCSEILDWQSDWQPGDCMDRIPGRFHDN